MTEEVKLDHRAKKRIKEVKRKARPGEYINSNLKNPVYKVREFLYMIIYLTTVILKKLVFKFAVFYLSNLLFFILFHIRLHKKRQGKDTRHFHGINLKNLKFCKLNNFL